MNEKQKLMWNGLLTELGFNKKDFNKLFQYIDIHAEHELKSSLMTGKDVETTLPLALRVFLELDDLEHIFIADEPEIKDFKETESGIEIISDTKLKTTRLNLVFNDEGIENIPDLEGNMAHEMIIETTKLLGEKLTKGNLYIYKLFTNTVKDKTITIQHHFYVE